VRLIHEVHPDEQPVCRGQYAYLKNGQPTGQVETWTINRLSDGATVTRADVDGRKANSAADLLTHLVRQPAGGRAKQLWLRYQWGEVEAAAWYTFDQAEAKAFRQVKGYSRREDTVEIAQGYEIDYHAVVAHDFVWRGYPSHARGKPWAVPIFSPDLWAPGGDALQGRPLRFTIQPREPGPVTVPVGSFPEVRHYAITLDDEVEALAWFDEHGIPLRWYYPAKQYDFVLVQYMRQD